LSKVKAPTQKGNWGALRKRRLKNDITEKKNEVAGGKGKKQGFHEASGGWESHTGRDRPKVFSRPKGDENNVRKDTRVNTTASRRKIKHMKTAKALKKSEK